MNREPVSRCRSTLLDLHYPTRGRVLPRLFAGRGERGAGPLYRGALVSGVGRRLLRSERLRRIAARAPRAALPLRWLWARVGLAQWEYVPEGWERAAGGSIRGWEVPEVAAAYEANWDEFRRLVTAPRLLGVIHEAVIGARLVEDDLHAHNAAVSFGYVLALAAQKRQTISVLDWGGALGHHYVLGSELLPGIQLDYTCKELAAVCERGRALLPEVRFVSDDSYADRLYDLVLASSSLQYQQDWRRTLRGLAARRERLRLRHTAAGDPRRRILRRPAARLRLRL